MFILHINVFGCHCRPDITCTGDVGNFIFYLLLPVYVRLLFNMKYFEMYLLVVLSLVELGTPFLLAGLWSVIMEISCFWVLDCNEVCIVLLISFCFVFVVTKPSMFKLLWCHPLRWWRYLHHPPRWWRYLHHSAEGGSNKNMHDDTPPGSRYIHVWVQDNVVIVAWKLRVIWYLFLLA